MRSDAHIVDLHADRGEYDKPRVMLTFNRTPRCGSDSGLGPPLENLPMDLICVGLTPYTGDEAATRRRDERRRSSLTLPHRSPILLPLQRNSLPSPHDSLPS